jgi:hypothetical protein
MSPRKFPLMKPPTFPNLKTYRGHQHFAERLLNRRSFLEKSGLTLGAVVGAGLLPGVTPHVMFGGIRSASGATPLPIPGGTDLLGDGRIFHVFLPATGAEPSTITDFNGFVGWAAVGGMGTHTPAGQSPEHLPFESDMRFMVGDFTGTDGKTHHGAFAFI